MRSVVTTGFALLVRSALGAECPSYNTSNQFACPDTVFFNKCTTGGCPLDENTTGEDRPNGWLIRIEPCGDFWKYNPTWAGAHMTMSTIQHYDDPQGSFSKLKDWLDSNDGPEWKPEKDFVYSRHSCRNNADFAWAGLGIESYFLHDVGLKAKELGFDGKLSGYHITLAYAPGWSINQDDYQNDPEFNKLNDMFRDASWQMVLLKMDADTKTIIKTDATQLRLPGKKAAITV